MANNPKDLAGNFDADETVGLFAGLLAEEEPLDRSALWRLGSWGVGAVGAVIVAVLANQSGMSSRRDQVAAADLARQSQQIQGLAREGQNEVRRLTTAIDTLNSDRDRLYARVTSLEQGLDSVTGTVAKQRIAASTPLSTQPASPAPAIGTVAAAPTGPSKPAERLASAAADRPATEKPAAIAPDKLPTIPSDKPAAAAGAQPQAGATVSAGAAPAASTVSEPMKSAWQVSTQSLASASSMTGPPDQPGPQLLDPAKPPSSATSDPAPEVIAAAPATADGSEETAKASVQRTEFGVDVGGANSVAGLRALWRGLLKTRANAPLASLQPIMTIRESASGLVMHLRLVAGPLHDADAAAKICAALSENNRPCETAVYDGQRLTMKDDPTPAAAPPRPATHRRASPPKHVIAPVAVPVPVPPPAPIPAAEEAPKQPEPSTLSLLFGRNSQ